MGFLLSSLLVASSLFPLGGVERTQLARNIVLLTEQVDEEGGAVDVWISPGAVGDGEQPGLGYALARYLSGEGSPLEEASRVNAATVVDVSWDYLRLGVSAHRGEFPDLAIALLRSIFYPAWEPSRFAALRGAWMEELRRDQRDPASHVEEALYTGRFQAHPYGRPPKGNMETAARLTMEALAAHHHTLMRRGRVVIVLVGPWSKGEALAWVTEAIGEQTGQPAQEEWGTGLDPEPKGRRGLVELHEPRSAASVTLGFPAPSVFDRPDVYVADVVYALLNLKGGPLQEAVRGLSRGSCKAASSFLTQRHPGTFRLSLSCADKREPPPGFLEKVLEEMREKPLPAQTLENAKLYLFTELALDTQSLLGWTAHLGFYETLDRFEFLQKYAQGIAQVTPEDVQRFARTFLRPEQAMAVVLTPARLK